VGEVGRGSRSTFQQLVYDGSAPVAVTDRQRFPGSRGYKLNAPDQPPLVGTATHLRISSLIQAQNAKLQGQSSRRVTVLILIALSVGILGLVIYKYKHAAAHTHKP